jgi:hypothetical protein
MGESVEKCGSCGLWRVSGRLCLGCGDRPKQSPIPTRQPCRRPWEATPVQDGPKGRLARTHSLQARDDVAGHGTVAAARGRLLSELRTLVAVA